MFQVSRAVADFGFTLSSVALIAATVGVVYFGKVRDHYTDEQISENISKTAEANAETAKLTESNTRLQLDLEKERLKRLALERKVEPRHLSNAQRANLGSRIESKSWKNAEIIWHGTGESEFYAKELASVFEQAGVRVKLHTLGMFIPSAWGLIVIKTTNDDSTQLQAILEDSAIESRIASSNSTIGEKDHPTLLVGTREDMTVPEDESR